MVDIVYNADLCSYQSIKAQKFNKTKRTSSCKPACKNLTWFLWTWTYLFVDFSIGTCRFSQTPFRENPGRFSESTANLRACLSLDCLCNMPKTLYNCVLDLPLSHQLVLYVVSYIQTCLHFLSSDVSVRMQSFYKCVSLHLVDPAGRGAFL